jgi:hypothetical protein
MIRHTLGAVASYLQRQLLFYQRYSIATLLFQQHHTKEWGEVRFEKRVLFSLMRLTKVRLSLSAQWLVSVVWQLLSICTQLTKILAYIG